MATARRQPAGTSLGIFVAVFTGAAAFGVCVAAQFLLLDCPGRRRSWPLGLIDVAAVIIGFLLPWLTAGRRRPVAIVLGVIGGAAPLVLLLRMLVHGVEGFCLTF